ncbi:MAG: Suppressor of fused protein, partial [Solirubrobacterales bacterium]|nr:Suppressor of fused protein [Solirubrobacterales bacterium]
MALVDALSLEGDNPVLQDVASHVEAVAGPVATVLRDPGAGAGATPIDVLVVDPTPARPYRTLVTAGMSARASTAPVGWGDCRYAELALALPRDWPWRPGHQPGGWPVDLLRSVARVPQVFGGWLWLDHTVAHGDPPRPYAPDTPLCAVVLRRVALLGPDMARVRRADGESAWILAVVPLHGDELALDAREGAAALGAALDRARVTELLDPRRPSVAAP